VPHVLGVGSRDLGRKAGTAQSISSRRPGCTGAVDAPIGKLLDFLLGLSVSGCAWMKGTATSEGRRDATSSRTIKLRTSNNPAAGIYNHQRR